MKKQVTGNRRYHHGDLERTLVSTALDVIAEEGLDALTLRRVGARAGVSRSALYRHFDDKTALLARVAADGFRVLNETLLRVRANAAPGVTDTLEVMAAAHVLFAQANPSQYTVMFGDMTKALCDDPVFRREAAAARDQIVDAVRDAQHAARLGAGDPVAIAEVMWALTVGIARLGASGPLEELAVLGVRWVSDGCLTPWRFPQ